MSGLPLNGYPHPRGSFIYPVNVPDADPGDDPLVSASWNEAYTPIILGACSQLMLESSLFSTHLPLNTKLGKMNDLLMRIGDAVPNDIPNVVHSRVFSFAPSEDDWSVVPGLYGTWVSDVGWVGEGHEFTTGVWESRVDIQYTFPIARPVRTLYAPSLEIDQTGWSGVPFTLDMFSSGYALSPGGLFVSQHWQYTMIPLYTSSIFEINLSSVGPVTVASGKVELHLRLAGFSVNPDSFSPPIRVSIPGVTVEWFETS